MGGTYSSLNYHLVFSTKNREPFIDHPDFERRLHQYLGGAIRGQKALPLIINGTADHVHLLIRWVPNGNLSNLLRDVKSGSSKWVHETFPMRRSFGWQDGFGAFSVSASQVQTVHHYVARQKEHHKTKNFQSEFRALLTAHDVAWDEEKIWL